MERDALAAWSLDEKVAVVTGAASGIGRASAMLMAQAGASVVCADIDEAGALETLALVEKSGSRGLARRVDVSNTAEVDGLVAATVAELGSLDIMANIAGIIAQRLVVDTDDELLEQILSINLKGIFAGSRAAARIMVAQGSGAIVNMASGAVDTPASGLACYGISKAGVVQLTRVLATEVGPYGVRVNAVAPGFVETAMTGRHFTSPDGEVDAGRREKVLGAISQAAPLRMVGEPRDIANAVLYLASDAARFVTGQIIRPNGGVAMPW